MRLAVTFSVLLLSLALSTWAHAASYLDAAALLLEESRRSVEFFERRTQDRKLAEAVHILAEARVKAGRQLEVMKEADRAHPHLLLALETMERALFAAKGGDTKRFFRLVRQAREEERSFRELLREAKLSLPESERQRR